MPELTADFQSLPEEYQCVIRLAQDMHKITVVPLQLLVGGWSGAVVYLVSVSFNETKRVEHCILKLDRKGKNARSDEVTRHNTVMRKAAPAFARAHIADLVFDRIEHEGAIAIFYRIAGQSLLKYLPLSRYERQNQLEVLFAHTNTVLLDEWNGGMHFEQAVHPQTVLHTWLGFRLDDGSNTERFLRETCGVNPDIAGLLINGHVLPNPYLLARRPESWGRARAIDAATGFMHGDLNTNNILVKFADDKESIDGYYLIDFALFKEDMPLLYDQRYLEFSYLLHANSQISFPKCVSFLTLLAVADSPDPQKVPVELSGVSAVIGAARNAFAAWVDANHPSLHDDLWGQYWLAGAAAGLNYTHKAGLPVQQRLAGLVYAAANLKRFAAMFNLPMPAGVELLYDEYQFNEDARKPSKAKQTKNNLPVQSTPFIGRAQQLNEIKEIIRNTEARLVTLVGPGGSGKTRLSLQAAQELLDQFPGGVYFVPLADDKDDRQFISRVAQQLEVREGGRPLLENVKDYLRDKRILLVLDNFEQLVSAAPVVADLLASAAQLKIITSSRIALNLHGERVFPVPPLELPKAENGLALEALLQNESMRLFVGRAQAVHPGFVLTKDNAAAAAEICRRLDGLPLAIELAAARIKLLQPQAILTRLDDRLKLLTGGARDLPARHQTLRNTLAWSFDLLHQDEKVLYARLGVFVGGFTIEAVEAVCNLDGTLDILENLSTLMNNSLLRQEETFDGQPRFEFLETIRAYALERLVERGELEILRERHARYYSGLILEQAGLEIYRSNSLHWLRWFAQEQDNIRAVLTWGLASPQGAPLGANLVFALFWFWYRHGHFFEGFEWAEKYLAVPEVQNTPPLRAMALSSLGILALWQGKQNIALSKLQEALSIVETLGEERLVAATRMANGIAFLNMGRDGDAQPLLEQAGRFFKENDPYFHALTLVHLGNTELGLGHPEQARAYHEQALTKAHLVGEVWLISFALNNLGEVARTQGQFHLARKYYEQCEAFLQPTGDQVDVARFVHNLGYIAQHEEEFDLAEAQFRQSLTMFRRLGNRRGIAECLAGLAGLGARKGQLEWGATLISAAESILKTTGGAWWPADRMEVERNLEMLRAALPANEFLAAQKTGAAMNIDQAIAFAANEP